MPAIPFDGNIDLQGTSKITNSPTPTAGTDVANKSYVDSAAQGQVFKTEVQAVGTANVSIAAPGATLDGVTLTSGMRILLTAQATGSQNGIWVWNGSASALTRPTDFAAASSQVPGTSVFVGQGTSFAKSVWTLNTTANVTVDTTAETWVQSNAVADISVTAPLTMSGNQISMTSPLPITNGGTNASTAAGARAALSAVGKFASTIGDGATTTFTVTHNLGTNDVQAQVWDMATGNWEVVGVQVTGVNTVSVGPFATAPATAGGTIGSGTGKRVVVMG